jgi:nanoRNase/pAp phosphatase (c-di-AMP/oligoRNAs hydrolase)
VSQLRKCFKIPTEIIDPQAIEIESDLTYTEHLIRVLDTKERSTRRETIKMFKIQWDHHMEEEATWEIESYLQRNFPDFLQANS